MIELDDATLARLQEVELEILLEIDRICQKRGIRYNIIAGTMLGAQRHEGFIPWDDDADVALLRPEYERFRAACATELDHERFYFQDIESTPGYRWGYGKLRRKGTLFLREHQEHMPYEQGVFVDVFPLDSIPEGRVGRASWNLKCFLLRKALWARVGKVADRSAFMRRVYALVDRIPERDLRGAYRWLVRRAKGISSDWVRILTFPTPNRQFGYLRRWYETSAPATFCGHEFAGVEDAEGYLTFKYGSWRELPPKEGRKTHPVSAIRLPERDEGGTTC